MIEITLMISANCANGNGGKDNDNDLDDIDSHGHFNTKENATLESLNKFIFMWQNDEDVYGV